MVGIAAGNLLGIVQESLPGDEIKRRFPSGVGEIEATAGYPDDDDLAQAIIIAEEAAGGPLDPHVLGRRFWVWAEDNGLGMGGLTGDVMETYGGNFPQRRRQSRSAGSSAREPRGVSILDASREAWSGGSAGNGAVMRCAPIAIRWGDDVAALARNSVVSAVPTHWDWRCGWSCVLLNLAVAAALRGAPALSADDLLAAGLDGVRASLPELEAFGYKASVPESVTAAVEHAVGVDLQDLAIDGMSMGFTLLALQIGLIGYWRATSFEEYLRRVIEAGGDTDTNGAIAGAILGARFGIDAIPQRWRSKVAEIRTDEPSLEDCADRLLAARDPSPADTLGAQGGGSRDA